MEDIKEKLLRYDFFKKMNFEIKSLVPENYRNGKVFLLRNLDDNMSYKVRLKHPLFPDTVKKELRVLKYISQYPGANNFPEIIYTDGNEEVMVTSYFEGVPLDECYYFSQEKKNEIVSKIEDKLKILHSMYSPAKDIINNRNFTNWYEWLKLIFDSYIAKIKEYKLLKAKDECFIYDFLEINRDYLENVRTSVIHGDLKPANIIYNQQREDVFIVDFESGKVGDPAFDTYRIYRDNWGYKEEYDRNPVYVLYAINLSLRWITYNLAKGIPTEKPQFEMLDKYLSLAKLQI